ncbi:Mth938-like domain-containing protein [Kiloniella sp. b19]|uniref:Mth938-like domain-containing protein n=1 Tax=Kiloniella sp. GXU_MW_B19 TaxID=3141326 RepID=UPI0031E101A1
MEVRLDIPEGVQIVETYGDGRFKVTGVYHEGSILITPEQTQSCPVSSIDELSLENFSFFFDGEQAVDVLLLGCGPKMRPVPSALKTELREKGLVVEPMDTGAACRTYNVLVSEERKVAALLIAVD